MKNEDPVLPPQRLQNISKWNNPAFQAVELKNTEILTTESRWFERGMEEAIYISPEPSWRYSMPSMEHLYRWSLNSEQKAKIMKNQIQTLNYRATLNPVLNRDGERYNLPPVWDQLRDNIVKTTVKADRDTYQSPHTTSPVTSAGWKNWRSWQESDKEIVSEQFYHGNQVQCSVWTLMFTLPHEIIISARV